MSDLVEVAITSDSNGSLWSCCAWDPRAGTNLTTYKGKKPRRPIRSSTNDTVFLPQAAEELQITPWRSSGMSSS